MASSSEPLGPPPRPATTTNHVTSTSEPFPDPKELDAATKVHTQGAFQIEARKLPISKAGPIDELNEKLGIPVPEMIFGDNLIKITHKPSNWSISFDAFGALNRVDKEGKKLLKVSYAKDWERTREDTTMKIKNIVKPYDWSYTTDYSGTESEGSSGQRLALGIDHYIPLALLQRRDPMLFFEEVILYESELDDNGISIYSCKVRVHERRMLLLCRLFMRLDGVVVRINDTRVYVDFDQNYVIREYTAKEELFQSLKRKLVMSGRLPDDVTIALRDPNILDPLLTVTKQMTDAVKFRE
ncbi:unnamed protein product [Clonostachys rhizophaga]|uniref:TIP41-like protein n=1 Tax=Clonostachys rhizophaga TaxID=160324 RepID=A0A9N9VP18_9HYPO|nr:unnamed protein product [Clonostachys rhizophaga]